MAKIIGKPLKNIPWEDKPQGYQYPVWRYSGNPIINRDDLFMSNSIFNSAVVPYGDGFAGVFRVDDMTRSQFLVTGFSKDAIHWDLNSEYIFPGYDPRLCEIDGWFYLSWVRIGNPGGTTIGIARTKDFKEFEEYPDATLPVSRNGVLFPRKVNGNYMLFSRPCDKGHTPYGELFLSQSPDLKNWGKHKFVMKPEKVWEATKI